MDIVLYSERQIGKIREASKVVAECHEIVRDMCVIGGTTRAIDEKVAAHIKAKGGNSPFLNYCMKGKEPFAGTVCASPNDVVVHGLPDDVPFKEGDLISIDIGVRLNGYIGDSAWTYPIGEVDDSAKHLLEVGKESLYAGIRAMKPKGRLMALCAAIQNEIESNAFSVVREFVGHGVGQTLHEQPQIPNYVIPETHLPVSGRILKPGMVLAVEPMVNEGSADVVADDVKWPVHTADGKRSVHFEHTIAVLRDRVEVLTIKSWEPESEIFG